MTPEFMNPNKLKWLVGKEIVSIKDHTLHLLIGDYLISDHEPVVPPSPEKLTSLPDGRIGQQKLDDWKSMHRFYAAVAKRGSHKIVEHGCQSTIGSSEALVGQSPCSACAKLYAQGPLRAKTHRHQGLVSMCICHRCGELHLVAIMIAKLLGSRCESYGEWHSFRRISSSLSIQQRSKASNLNGPLAPNGGKSFVCCEAQNCRLSAIWPPRGMHRPVMDLLVRFPDNDWRVE